MEDNIEGEDNIGREDNVRGMDHIGWEDSVWGIVDASTMILLVEEEVNDCLLEA